MDLPATVQVDGSEHHSNGAPPTASKDSVVYKLVSLHSDTAVQQARSLSFTPSTDVSIGRDKNNCQLAFPECAVLSRIHCRIFSLGRDVFVHDFSSNGTYVNGKVMGKGNKHILRPGDVIAAIHPKGEGAEDFSWKFVPPKEEESSPVNGVHAAYNLGKVLGTGNFATVKLGTSKLTDQTVAVKIIEKKRFALTQSDFSFSSLTHEVEILRKMNHKNIIGIHDVYDDPQSFTMVLELVKHGDLFDYIVGRCPSPFKEHEAKNLFVQLVEAMLYMHSKQVVHRDLKPENILVCVDPAFQIPGFCDDHQRNARNVPVDKVTLKVTDFGLAKFCADNDVMTTMCGTPTYLAPEVLIPSKTGEKKAEGYKWSVDVWSLGVILFILLSGTPPKDPQRGELVFNKHFNDVSKEAKNLVVGMLKIDPAQRYDLNDIVTHPWLKGCDVRGKELAIKKPSSLILSGTVLLQPQPTTEVQPDGADTDLEDSDTEGSPGIRKRGRPDDVPLKTKIVWSWKNQLHKADEDPSAWTNYGETESDHIEKMKEKGVRTCKIGDGTYRVSFEGMFQYNKVDTTKQRPVKRELVKIPSVKV